MSSKLLAGAALGAALMFMFDPHQGRQRRALVRDKLINYVRWGSRALEGKAEDFGNRAYDVMAETRSALNAATGEVQERVAGTP